ncbi:MAG: hypothetical protein FJ404_12515 [Verrucomicrobia bacterium]|nr:hypothetical protein [Verrucomicrobiota bacterium]
MKPSHGNPSRKGYALIMVLVFTGIGLAMVGAALRWASNNAMLTQRNNLFISNVSVAEVATQKVIAKVAQDFQTNGESYVYDKLGDYRRLVPVPSENPVWSNYRFSDGRGNTDRTFVERLTPRTYGLLTTKYTGLQGYGATYRVLSNARLLASSSGSMVSAVRQDIQLAEIPLFEYAAYYAIDLEICPGFNFDILGPVHCTENLYLQPGGARLSFGSHVTAGKQLVQGKKPGDPNLRSPGVIEFRGERDGGVRAVNIPIGVPNTSNNLRLLVEIPSTAESPSSPLGKHRFYNQADLIVLVSNTITRVFSGAYNGFSTVIPATNLFDTTVIVTNRTGRGRGRGRKTRVTYTTNVYDGILSTNQIFYDRRENRNVLATEFDVDEMIDVMPYLVSVLGRQPRVIYVADHRSQSSTNMTALRIVNADTLPTGGLAIVTPNPMYVVGHFNVSPDEIGTANTAGSQPALLVSDAITILSTNWSDMNSGLTIASRVARPTTVNAAMITGIVPTRSGAYSGGFENSLRLLEDWNGLRLNYNGSIAVLYQSLYATAPITSGSTIYRPPIRSFAYDSNFDDVKKLPPATPFLRTVMRASYAQIKPDLIE